MTSSGTVIGTVRLESFQRRRERHKVPLTAMYAKDYAGRGIGRRLLEEALAQARKNGRCGTGEPNSDRRQPEPLCLCIQL